VLMNESSDIKFARGLKSYPIRLTSPNDKTTIILLCFTDVNTRLNEWSSDIKLTYGLKSYSIRLMSPNDKTIILLCFTDTNTHLSEWI